MALSQGDMIARYTSGVAFAAQNNLYVQGIQSKIQGVTVGTDVAQRWAQRVTAPSTGQKWFENYARGLAGGGGGAPMALQR